MQMTFDAKSLAAALNVAASCCGKVRTGPFAGKVRLVVADMDARVEATDGVSWMSVAVPSIGAVYDEDGMAMIDHALVGTLLGKCRGGVEFETGRPKVRRVSLLASEAPDVLHVRFAGGSVELPWDDGEAFPEPPAFAEAGARRLAATDLADLIDRTAFACDTDINPRFCLGGVCLEFPGVSNVPCPQVIAIGTDGRRIAVARCPCEADDPAEHRPDVGPRTAPVVPLAGLRAIRKLLSLCDPGDTAEVGFAGAGRFQVRIPAGAISVRLMEGRFPRWRDAADLFPSGEAASVRFEAASTLLDAVKLAEVGCTAESCAVDFVLDPSLLRLHAQAPGEGEAKIDLPAISGGGDRRVFSLNAYLFREGIARCDPAADVELRIPDDAKRPVEVRQGGYLYSLMPVVRE